MRIAYLAVKHILRGGGIEKYTLELGRRLVAKGHEVTVFTMDHYGHVSPWVEGMRTVRLPCIKHPAAEKLSASACASFRLLASDMKFDIVHLHSVAAGAFGFFACLGKRAKTVLQMHGIEWQRSRWGGTGRGVLKALEVLSLRSQDAYTAVSQTQCSFYRDHYGIPMKYISTGAPVRDPEPPDEILKLGLEPGKYVLFASRLVPEKGAHYLVRAFRDLKSDCKLVIAGDAKGENAYKLLLREASRNDARILFPGYVEGKTLAELFSHAAVYVQPSEIEGLSIALLEAMGYGNCCLASDIPENKEALDGAGLTFRSKDPSDLGAKLAILLANRALRDNCASRARDRVRTHYSWDRVASEFELLYQSLL